MSKRSRRPRRTPAPVCVVRARLRWRGLFGVPRHDGDTAAHPRDATAKAQADAAIATRDKRHLAGAIEQSLGHALSINAPAGFGVPRC